MKLQIPAILLGAALFMGCHSSASIVADHFNEMTTIANAQSADCEAMGTQLNTYLDSHIQELSTALLDKGNASSKDTKRLYDSSLLLHKATEACTNDSMNAFRKKLADVILKVTPETPQG